MHVAFPKGVSEGMLFYSENSLSIFSSLLSLSREVDSNKSQDFPAPIFLKKKVIVTYYLPSSCGQLG